jgi:hypothetical protein
VAKATLVAVLETLGELTGAHQGSVLIAAANVNYGVKNDKTALRLARWAVILR